MKIELQNYKCFEKQEIDLKKYNILIGENNSGKSSILKFFILLFQSLGDIKSNLSLNNLIDFGTYEDIIYNNDASKPLIFKFTINSDEYFDYFRSFLSYEEKDVVVQKHYSKEDFFESVLSAKLKDIIVTITINKFLTKKHELKITIYNEAIGELAVKQVEKKSNSEFNIDPFCSLSFANSEGVIDINEAHQIGVTKNSFLNFVNGPDLRKYCENNHDYKLFHKFAYLLISQNFIENFFSKILYVNPIHSFPERIYNTNISSSFASINLQRIITTISDEELSESVRNKFHNDFNEALQFSGLAEEISIKKMPNMAISTVAIKNRGRWSNICDVGYGVPVQIPIIFSVMYNQNKIILIEQPEIHVHPKLQSRLIETIMKYNNNNQIIIETHSEHIIRKLQSIVKRSNYNITSEKIVINYLKIEDNKTILSKHLINANGLLKPNLPKGFYDNSYELAKELMSF